MDSKVFDEHDFKTSKKIKIKTVSGDQKHLNMCLCLVPTLTRTTANFIKALSHLFMAGHPGVGGVHNWWRWRCNHAIP